jgi:hypothetical protein
MKNVSKQIDDRIGFIWDRLDNEVNDQVDLDVYYGVKTKVQFTIDDEINDQIFEQIKTQTKK